MSRIIDFAKLNQLYTFKFVYILQFKVPMLKQREHWSSRLGFILAAAGSAIGLGTLWKFPYVTGENGGGLFVLIYILCTFLIGIPVFIAELILGRRAQRGAVGIFDQLSGHSTLWKTTGWLGVASAFLMMSFYSVVAGWGLNYVLMSLNQFYEGRTAQEIADSFTILESSGDISLFWHGIFTLLTLAMVYPGIRQGIEFWSKIMTTSLLVLLLALVGFSMTLEGFREAIQFLFSPNWAEFKFSGALEALGLSFFTLSLGHGVMLTYGSYMHHREDIPKTSGIIGLMIIVISLLAGLMIFPVIFTFGFAPQEGPGLVFKTLPVLFAKLPAPLLISTAFFVLFVFTALTSSIALVEVVVANFIDLLGWSRKKSVVIVGIAVFLFGIPSALSASRMIFPNWSLLYGKSFFATINDLVSVWLLPISGLMVSLFTGWALDQKISREEFSFGTAYPMFWRPWLFCIRWIVPLAILAVLLQKSGLFDIDRLIARHP
ncbi:MAG: sodium-dependent transporter [Waddliaceae bacterium]